MFDDFFETASELTRTGRPFATAVVVRAEKPTSGKPGDRAIVTLDGVMHGWIGGSCAQPTVIREALAALKQDRSRLVRLAPEGEGGALPLDSERLDGVVSMPMTCFSGGTLDIFIEPHHPRPRLLIVGSLPVARALAHLGRAMNYHVAMVAPGEERLETPEGVDEMVGSVEKLAARVTPLSFFVVATHGEYDEPALRAAFDTDVPYIGLVASPKRGAAVRDALAAAGVSKQDLARMKFPAGLDIGARRGDEIALSIMAEIIQVRQGLEQLAWEDAEAAEAAATGASEAGGAADVSAETPGEPAEPATAIDPICQMEVKIEGALHTHEWAGRTWYFCCDGCRRKFAENPAAWAVA